MNIHNIHMHIHEGAYLKKKKRENHLKKKDRRILFERPSSSNSAITGAGSPFLGFRRVLERISSLEGSEEIRLERNMWSKPSR